jgi:hypothetical protein
VRAARAVAALTTLALLVAGCGGEGMDWQQVRTRSAEAIDHAWQAADGPADPDVELTLVECPDSPGLGPGARFVLETRLSAPLPGDDAAEVRLRDLEETLVERYGADRVEVAAVGAATFVRWDDRTFSGNVGHRGDRLTAQVLSPCHEPPFTEYERFTAPGFDAAAELQSMRPHS